MASDLSDPAVQQNVLQTINVSEVLTIHFCCKALWNWPDWGANYSVASFSCFHELQCTENRWQVNCCFNHSILSLHLCKEYLTAVKWKILFLLQIKYWTFWCIDCFASIKSNMLENAWSGRNLWKVNNRWIAILVKYGFITLLQRIVNCARCNT